MKPHVIEEALNALQGQWSGSGNHRSGQEAKHVNNNNDITKGFH